MAVTARATHRPPGHALIRHAVAADQRFIAATWFRNMLRGNRAPRIRRRLNAAIDRILDDATTRALVAESGDRILGWLVYAEAPVGRVCHYAYVRDDERGRGLARRMIAAAWPGSDARMILTCEGPATARFIAEHRNVLCMTIEEVLG